MTRLKHAWPLLLLIPFLNKPLHIDDAVFLRAADNLPYWLLGAEAGVVEFDGIRHDALTPYESTHPPLLPWLLKWGTLLGGDQQVWIYHGLMLIFPLILILLGRRHRDSFHGPWPFLILATPYFFVNSHNLMADAPLTILWLGAVLEAIRIDRPGAPWRLTAYLTSAVLMALQALALFPLLTAWFLLDGNASKRAFTPLAVAGGILALFFGIIYFQTGYAPLLSPTIDVGVHSLAVQGLSRDYWLHKLFAVGTLTGGLLLFFTPFTWRTLHPKRWTAHLLPTFAGTLTILALVEQEQLIAVYPPLGASMLRILLGIGVFWWVYGLLALTKTLDPKQSRNRHQRAVSITLLLWFFGVTAYNLLFLPAGAARYLLPALPAMILLLIQADAFTALKPKTWLIPITMTAAAFFLGYVDQGQAEAERRLLQQIATQVEDFDKLYFRDDHGLYRHLKQKGAHYLAASDPFPQSGAYLLDGGKLRIPVGTNAERIATLEDPGFHGFTLHHPKSRAGFYNSRDGFLPLTKPGKARTLILYKVP